MQEVTHLGQKLCEYCEPPTWKPIDQFYKNRNYKDGRMSKCISCTNKQNNGYYYKARDRKIAQQNEGNEIIETHTMQDKSEQLKLCNTCNPPQYKPISEFHNRFMSRDGKASECKSCVGKRGSEWAKNHPGNYIERKRFDNILRKYGITRNDYLFLLKSQNGKCAICSRPELESAYGRLCLDHDHTTNVVRGLLCHYCNMAIGLFQENPDILSAAMAYLEKHGLLTGGIVA